MPSLAFLQFSWRTTGGAIYNLQQCPMRSWPQAVLRLPQPRAQYMKLFSVKTGTYIKLSVIVMECYFITMTLRMIFCTFHRPAETSAIFKKVNFWWQIWMKVCEQVESGWQGCVTSHIPKRPSIMSTHEASKATKQGFTHTTWSVQNKHNDNRAVMEQKS